MRKLLETLVPPGFELIHRGRSHLAIRRDAGERLRELAWAEPAARTAEPAGSSRTGRGATQCVVYDPAGPRRAVFRRYRRGGAFRWLTRDKLFEAARPFRELDVVERVKAGGVPTVDVLAVRVDRVAPFVYEGEMVTDELVDAPDLIAWLAQPDAFDPVTRRGIIATIGRVVAQLHRAGVLHADLHLKNLLLRAGPPPAVFVIDLDKSVRRESLTDDERFANLRRFDRSTEKYNLFEGAAISRADRVRMLRAYLAEYGDGRVATPTDRARLRDAVRRWPPRYRFRRMKWALKKALRGGAR